MFTCAHWPSDTITHQPTLPPNPGLGYDRGMKTFHVWLKDREVPIVVEGETAADDDNGLKIKDSEKKASSGESVGEFNGAIG